ncbi:MAG: DNA repair protein RadA [Candidatus Buchananbacteria bacterium]|nr:DNA repair protein RadA [Candidatus Buchananbacteria bacterium]
MGKITEIYICSNCDSQSPKWQGRCPECGQWGTLEKSLQPSQASSRATQNNFPAAKVVSFSDIKTGDYERLKTTIDEFDRVLGGGFVRGSLILLGGEPGIGKSTLVLQISEKVTQPVLYVSGEESAQQIKTRIDRLNINYQNIRFVGETNIESIIGAISEQKPALAIIDSIQTIYSNESPSGAGSINQVRICTTKLLEVAKKNNITIMIIGHVTKFGEVAGPKTLEHLVDTVLYLEGDQYHSFRILRTAKNRFGSTSEVGIFEMQSHGLAEIKNPSAIFLDEQKPAEGSVITATLEGSRIFMLEVQALTSLTVFGYPQRKTNGFDLNRLQLLCATLSRRAGQKLANQDIYLNLVGGLKVSEPAIDLAVCLAIVSALKNKSLDHSMVVFGEVGLGGEVRPVNQAAKRISEAEKLGFKNIIIPESGEKINSKIKISRVKNLADAIKLMI